MRKRLKQLSRPSRQALWFLGSLFICIAAVSAGSLFAERKAAAGCRPFASPGAEVWLALGQSNAANHAEIRHSAGPKVAAFDGRGCIPARDPLPGGDGPGGSIWVPLAQAWMGESGAERVLIAVTARSSTSVMDWTPGDRLHRRAERMIEKLQERGLHVTRILWVQGEADAILGTTGEAYAEALERALGPLHRQSGAPVFIGLVSRCGAAGSAAVRSAQAQLIAERRWALPGPDLDLIGPEERYQRCHFAQRGQEHAVELWLASLRGTGI